ncbi:hypothetical protein ACF0H5_009900 [Mactra antiquata]
MSLISMSMIRQICIGRLQSLWLSCGTKIFIIVSRSTEQQGKQLYDVPRINPQHSYFPCQIGKAGYLHLLARIIKWDSK